MRLAKYLASAGIASRRAAEKLIVAKRVGVNGQLITDPAYNVDNSDKVEFDGSRIKPVVDDEFTYIILHKPEKVLSTMSPGKEKGACLADLLPDDVRLHPAGRLDFDTSGLILLTNDGRLTQNLTHPSRKVEKEYHLKTNRSLTERDYKRLLRGISIDGRVVDVDDLSSVKGGRLSITIHEGRKRIVRRLFAEMGYRVTELKRVRIGQISLGRLAKGRWRNLSVHEIALLKDHS